MEGRMPKMVSLRLDEELLEWADGYAKERDVSRSELLAQGLRSFRQDCEAGVPEIRAQARVVASPNSVGVCPKNAEGHVFAPASKDPRRSCVHCSRPGRDGVDERGGFFAEATMARADFFSGLRFPASANGVAKRA